MATGWEEEEEGGTRADKSKHSCFSVGCSHDQWSGRDMPGLCRDRTHYITYVSSPSFCWQLSQMSDSGSSVCVCLSVCICARLSVQRGGPLGTLLSSSRVHLPYPSPTRGTSLPLSSFSFHPSPSLPTNSRQLSRTCFSVLGRWDHATDHLPVPSLFLLPFKNFFNCAVKVKKLPRHCILRTLQ